MKRFLILFLAVMLMLISGCTSDNHSIGDDTGGNTQEISSAEDSDLPGDMESLPEKENTTPSQSDESTAGISPTTEQRSDADTVNVSKADTPSETKPTESHTPPSESKSPADIPASKPSEETPPAAENPPVTQPPETEESKGPEPTAPDPPVVNPPPTASKPEPDMESEYRRIIREVTEYAHSYTSKGFTFVWDDSLVFGWETGYMGTPRVKYEGVDGVISSLKYHVDKIVNTVTDPANGITAVSANYKVMQVTVDGDIAFVVLYG